MNHFDLIHICMSSECLNEPGVEAQSEERGDKIHVRCGLCGRRREYPKEALNLESTKLVAKHLWGVFTVTERYVDGTIQWVTPSVKTHWKMS